MCGRVHPLAPRFYITAENRGTCRALWCSVPGAGSRRVSSLRESSLTIRVAVTAAPPMTIADVPVQAGGSPRRAVGEGGHFEGGSVQHNQNEFGIQHDDRRVRREKAQAAATAATIQRAMALSAALLEDDDEAISASIAGRKPLFASRHRSADDVRAGGWGAGGGNDPNNADDEVGDDYDEPVNIAVVSRCRPLLLREIRLGVRKAVFCDGSDIVVSDEALPTKRSRRFGFDRVFGTSLPSFNACTVYCVDGPYPEHKSIYFRRSQPNLNCYMRNTRCVFEIFMDIAVGSFDQVTSSSNPAHPCAIFTERVLQVPGPVRPEFTPKRSIRWFKKCSMDSTALFWRTAKPDPAKPLPWKAGW